MEEALMPHLHVACGESVPGDLADFDSHVILCPESSLAELEVYARAGYGAAAQRIERRSW
jgi:hypothetical protein